MIIEVSFIFLKKKLGLQIYFVQYCSQSKMVATRLEISSVYKAAYFWVCKYQFTSYL